MPILWIAGNHDCWGDDILRNDIGVAYRVGRVRGISPDGKRDEHGDGLREKKTAGIVSCVR